MIRGHDLRPLPLLASHGAHSGGLLKARVSQLDRDLIVDALRTYRGSVTATAKHLGITPRMIRYKVKKLGIDSRQFSESQV